MDFEAANFRSPIIFPPMKYLSILLLLLPPFFSCDSPAKVASTPEQPNIILIMTDDQGYGDIAAHGNPWIKTPHLDALHDESVRFTNFHVATTCAPTRSGLLSGVNCNRAGAWHTVVGRSFLGTRFNTLAEELGEEGYTSGIFGKWHLGDNYPFRPQDRGFDEVLVHGGGGIGQTPDVWGNDYFDDTYFHNGERKKYQGYCTDVWFEEGMKFIEESAAKEEPFFAYIATNAPHGPFHIEEKYVEPYRDNPDIPNPNFYGMIANFDDNLGRLRAMLKTKGLEENTILIFLTDNGSSAGAKLDGNGNVTKGFNAGMRGMKVSQYEGGHRVPLFIKFPKNAGIAPTTHHELTTYTDILPTLVDYVGGELTVDYPLDGVSLLPLLQQGAQPELTDRYVVVDTQRDDLPVKGKRSCVMQGDWRLVDAKNLYNLANDPGQRENLFEGEASRAVAMQEAYEAWWSRLEKDIAITNRIIVGHPAENPSLLTAHDWHSEKIPPWNQKHIRAGKVDNGYWALDLAEAGTYSFKLYRWPPEIKHPFSATLPAGNPVPGGKPYAEGVSLKSTSIKLKIGESVVESEGANDMEMYRLMGVEDLPAGPIELQTWITDADGVTRGAYYVEVERLE